MDRSRLIVALSLVLAFLSTILGLVNIGTSSSSSGFTSSTQTVLTAFEAGVAVIDLNGVIQDGYSSPGVVGAETVITQLNQAEHNPAIRGVILAINSPGGTVGGTKKIFDRVMDLRSRKHVAAVVSDIAASGGYYVASAAEHSVGYESSIIGSIGVIMLRPNVSGLMNDYGVRVEPLTAGRYKDMSLPFRELTGEERAMYQQILDDSYLQFLNDVRSGRGQSQTTVEEWAEGRIYSGAAAQKLDMIDEIGNMDQAILWIKNELKMSAEDELRIYRPQRSFWEEFMAGAPIQRSLFGFFVPQPAGSTPTVFPGTSPVWYLFPGAISIPTQGL